MLERTPACSGMNIATNLYRPQKKSELVVNPLLTCNFNCDLMGEVT
jgi:hypothetical protein